MSIYKTMLVDVKVNGISVSAEVSIVIEEDYDHGTSDLESLDASKLKSGAMFMASIKVTAKAHGQEGFDSLGGCLIRPNNMFNSEPFQDDVDLIVKEHTMIENAINDLVYNIIATANSLKQFILTRGES